MKILLIGEYSNLHWTLAKGLKDLGHKAVVASDGCGWQGNYRDIDISLKGNRFYDKIRYRFDILKNIQNFKGYDVVQVISPVFFKLNSSDIIKIFDFLKKHNRKVFLGAFGTDFYYTKACLENMFRYSDFMVPGMKNKLPENNINWTKSPLKELNEKLAEMCDGIISCLYEYKVAYENIWGYKSQYIPLPIDTDKIKPSAIYDGKAKFFMGVQKSKAHLKGCDVMSEVLNEVCSKYKDICEFKLVESLPYNKYMEIMNGCNILVDQLYSYSPGMNGLLGMAKGMATISGGEPEIYTILGETDNCPIINPIPDKEDIFNKFTNLVENIDKIEEIGKNSRKFVEKHHNYIDVAMKYIDFWRSR
ncbi:MAG: glycosyltransferase [Bacteroidales bacterium]|nr:glycosyltransferase [Bacteroidales bacterium]